MPRRIALLCVAVLAVAPAAGAQAAPFRDRAPDGPSAKLQAKAAQASGSTIAVPTAEGYSVPVSFTSEAGVNPELAGSYVTYLDSLPHGTELARLRLLIAAPNQVGTLCGGTDEDGILGCYNGESGDMIVPSTGLDTTTPDGKYSVRYVITHEYGHHIAANRRNTLMGVSALDLGPKYWASYELVCNQALENKLFPAYEGNDFNRYHANPGENWAEAYARLTFPEQPWDFSPLLQPDAGAMDAVRRDVLTPWAKNATKRFTMHTGRNRQAFTVPLTLDGSLSATVRGPKGSEVSVLVTSGSQRVGRSRRQGRSDRWSLASGCRERPIEPLTLTTTRSGGASGPVRLTVSYPG